VHARPVGETKTMDPFVDAMWRAYRKAAPQQDFSGKNRKWIPGREGKWEPNPRPES